MESCRKNRRDENDMKVKGEKNKGRENVFLKTPGNSA